MVKVSPEERREYDKKTALYHKTIDRLLKREKTLTEGEGGTENRIALVEVMINVTSYYIILNRISQSMLDIKREEALQEGRKALHRCILSMEALVGKYLDTELAGDEEEKPAVLGLLSAKERYLLVRKIGLILRLLELGYGEHTKWRGLFVDLEGRYAVVAKNIFNFKDALVNLDPRSGDYEPTAYHLKLIKKLFRHAADRYREEAEFSSHRREYLMRAINLLDCLRRIHLYVGERHEVELIKRQLDAWSNRLDIELKRSGGAQ